MTSSLPDRWKDLVAGFPGVARAVTSVRRREARAAARMHGVDVTFDRGGIRLTKPGRSVRLAASHLLYVETVAREFDDFWHAVEPREEGGMRTVDYSKPAFHRYTGYDLGFWLSSFPEEPGAIDAYQHRMPPSAGEIVFDIGAYCGVSTYFFARWVGDTGRVYAFEPDPSSFELLQRNVTLHGLRNVIPVPRAIAATTGPRRFNADATLGAALSDVTPRGVFTPTAPVMTATLEATCAELGVVPDVVKVDVEGAELEILESSIAFLQAHPCRVIIDSSHWVAGARTTRRVETLLARAGYDFESSDMYGAVTTWGWARTRAPGVADPSSRDAT